MAFKARAPCEQRESNDQSSAHNFISPAHTNDSEHTQFNSGSRWHNGRSHSGPHKINYNKCDWTALKRLALLLISLREGKARREAANINRHSLFYAGFIMSQAFTARMLSCFQNMKVYRALLHHTNMIYDNSSSLSTTVKHGIHHSPADTMLTAGRSTPGGASASARGSGTQMCRASSAGQHAGIWSSIFPNIKETAVLHLIVQKWVSCQCCGSPSAAR